jgi:hypothetical protein
MALFSFIDWTVWMSLGIGLGVSGLVYVLCGYVMPRRRHQSKLALPSVENMSWEDLLQLLKGRCAAAKLRKAESGEGEELAPDELMEVLLAELPKRAARPPSSPSADVGLSPTGSERRTSRRRWANPTEVLLSSPYHDKPLHGLVVNQSAGGLAILVDLPFNADTTLVVRAMDAPKDVPSVEISVRHVQQVSKLWIVGCQYKQEVPWNVKVWFG